MSLTKCYACKRVISTDTPTCSHCGANYRPRKHANFAALCLLAVACALAYPILTDLYR
jgi:hypothetical protein